MLPCQTPLLHDTAHASWRGIPDPRRCYEVKPLIGDEELGAASDDRYPIVQMNPMRSTALPSEDDGKQPVTERQATCHGKKAAKRIWQIKV